MANPAVILDADLRFNKRGITRQVQQFQNLVNRKDAFRLNTKGITEPLGQISKSAQEFDKSLAASNARVLAFGASVGIIAGVQRAFAALVSETIQVEKSLADINVILNETTRGLGVFSNKLFEIAKNTGQSFRTAAAAATELARQGLGAEETLRRVNDALILTRLSGIDATRAVEGLTAVVNGFARQALNTTEIINTLANVDAAFAVSTTDLVEALARVGSTAQSAGVGFNELISIVTAAQQITARGGSVIGNSLKTIFTRLQRSSTLDALEDLGIATKNANGGFRDGISLLKDLANSYDTLGDGQRAYVSELVGGVFQINVLKALLGDLTREVSIYDGALSTANRTTDEAIRRNERLNETISSSVNEVKNNISQLLSTVGNVGADAPIKNILNIVNRVTETLTKGLGEEAGSNIAKGFIAGFGNILGGPAFISAIILASRLLFTTFGFAAKSLKGILKVGTETEKIKVLQAGINKALQEAGTSYNAILAGAKSVQAAEIKVLEILRQQNALRKGSIGINVGASLSKQGYRFNSDDSVFRRTKFRNFAKGSDLSSAILKEKRSIQGGVGGAKKNADPVLIPNFNFKKGKKGPIIANTDEIFVPNFGGTGADAILNRDMIRKIGKPDGAQKLAAKGSIPNFANGRRDIKTGQFTAFDTATKSLLSTLILTTKELRKTLGPKTSFKGFTSRSPDVKGGFSSQINPFPETPLKKIQLSNPGIRSQISKTFLEKGLNQNLENILDSNLKTLNKNSFNTPSPHRFGQISSIRNFINQDPAQNLKDPRFFQNISTLSNSRDLNTDFQIRVKNKITQNGDSLATALQTSAKEVQKLNKIQPSKMIKVVNSTARELSNFETELKQQRSEIRQSLTELKRSDKEKSILLKSEKQNLSKKDRGFLGSQERSRFFRESGLSEGVFRGLDPKSKSQINGIIKSRVAEQIIERTPLERQNAVARSFGRATPNQRTGPGKFSRFINSDKFTTGAFASSFALSLLSGFTGNGSTSKGLQGAGIGASLGIFGGGPGILAGAAIGGGAGILQNEIKKLGLNLEELDKQFQKINSTFQKNNEAVQLFVKTQSSLKESIESGASESQIKILRDKVIEQFANINDSDLRNKLLSAGGDVTKQIQFAEESRRKGEQNAAKAGLGSLFGSISKENSFAGIDRAGINKFKNSLIGKITNLVLTGSDDVFRGENSTQKNLFDKKSNLSSSQIDRLSRELVGAGRLGEAGTGKNEEADKLLKGLARSLKSGNVNGLISILNDFGLEGKKIVNVFSDASEQAQFLRKSLNFAKEVQESRKLANANADLVDKTARYIKELQRIDSILTIQNDLVNLERKNQENLNIQRKRGLLTIDSSSLSSQNIRNRSNQIVAEALQNRQRQEGEALLSKQKGGIRALINGDDNFTRKEIKELTFGLQEIEDSSSLVPFLKTLIEKSGNDVFEKDGAETRKKLENILVETIRTNNTLKENQNFQKLSLNQLQEIQRVTAAQNKLKGALGGVDPLKVGKGILSGKTSIQDIISPFGNLAQAGLNRKRLERRNQRFSQTRADGSPSPFAIQADNAALREAILKSAQFDFIGELSGLPDGFQQQKDKARRTIASDIFSKNASQQLSSIKGTLGLSSQRQADRAVKSKDPKALQNEINRLEKIKNQSGLSNSRRDSAEQAQEILKTFKEIIGSLNEPTDLNDKTVKAIQDLGEGASLNDIKLAIGADRSAASKELDILKTNFEKESSKQKDAAEIADLKAQRQEKEAKRDLQKRNQEKAVLDQKFNFRQNKKTSANKFPLSSESFVPFGTGVPAKKDIFKGIPNRDLLDPIIQGIKKGEIQTIGGAARNVSQDIDFVDIRKAISNANDGRTNENLIVDFIRNAFKDIPNLLSEPKSIPQNDKLIIEIEKLTKAIAEKTAQEKESEALSDSLNKIVENGELKSVDRGEETIVRGSPSSSVTLVVPPELDATITNLQNLIIDFSKAGTNVLESKINSIVDLRLDITSDGNVTKAELDLISNAIKDLKEQISEIRRNTSNKIKTPGISTSTSLRLGGS